MAEDSKTYAERGNAQHMFDQIRSSVRTLAEKNKENEVTSDSNFNSAGVYMLYVECFADTSIIPFYIGQTGDFQKRHKQHFSEVLALNRLDRECYKYALYTDLYIGRARACKIFSYMVNHGCSLKDLHMIVLEEIEDEKQRLETEQNYIDSLYAPFFGFNQYNSVLRRIEIFQGNLDKSEYFLSVEQDVETLLQYPLFGYGIYNWYRSCETFYGAISTKQLQERTPISFLTILDSHRRLEEIRERIIDIKRYNSWDAEAEAWDICKKTINDYFSARRLRSEEKKKLVVNICLFGFENSRRDLEKYFSKYTDRIDEDIFEIIDRLHGDKIHSIKQQISNNQHEYRMLEKERENLNDTVFGTLLPKHYKSHPLGAIDKSISFDISGDEENVCFLNVEFTCFKSDYKYDRYPSVCRISYHIIRNGETNARTVYIDNPLVDFFCCDDLFYCESGRSYGPFNPFLQGRSETHIPVAMEYKNGINEWTLRDKDFEDFNEVFKEINGLIDEKTKVIYSTSGYKSTILRFTSCAELSDTILTKKLKRLCK